MPGSKFWHTMVHLAQVGVDEVCDGVGGVGEHDSVDRVFAGLGGLHHEIDQALAIEPLVHETTQVGFGDPFALYDHRRRRAGVVHQPEPSKSTHVTIVVVTSGSDRRDQLAFDREVSVAGSVPYGSLVATSTNIGVPLCARCVLGVAGPRSRSVDIVCRGCDIDAEATLSRSDLDVIELDTTHVGRPTCH